MPFPCAFDDDIQRLELRFPIKLGFNFLRRSDESWRIARSARLFNRFDLSSRDFATGVNDLSDTGAASSAEVIESAGGGSESQDVRVREVDNVNVISNTGSIGCIVIRSVNLDAWALAERHPHHGGNQMRLRPVIFAEVLGGAGGVEV